MKAKRIIAQDDLNEVIVYGGLLCTRGEAIQYMKECHASDKEIEYYMLGHDRVHPNPKTIKILKIANMWHEFSNKGIE
jgi:hypothetical protein